MWLQGPNCGSCQHIQVFMWCTILHCVSVAVNCVLKFGSEGSAPTPRLVSARTQHRFACPLSACPLIVRGMANSIGLSELVRVMQTPGDEPHHAHAAPARHAPC
jgi:hypothetical protein